MKSIDSFPNLWDSNADLVGVNVTVPHKQAVNKYLQHLDASAENVGATNVVVRRDNELIGYNTDYLAFKHSLECWLDGAKIGQALVLGSGGASKAVKVALEDLRIAYAVVSRSNANGDLTYDEICAKPSLMNTSKVIINTTPLGMYPKVESFPELPYSQLHSDSFLYDLVYNPEETAFMKRGLEQGAQVKNGLEMLQLQAEESWKIWNSLRWILNSLQNTSRQGISQKQLGK